MTWGRGAVQGYAAREIAAAPVRLAPRRAYGDGVSNWGGTLGGGGDVAHLDPTGRRRPRPLLRTLIGEVLRRNRLGQRRTLADVARRAGVSVPYLSEVERGRKEVSSELLAAVCDALRIDLSDLLSEVERDLRAHHAPVVRLETARRRRDTASPARGPGDAVLLAA
jgi:transcriptional regulator with XRE-family HTH domain